MRRQANELAPMPRLTAQWFPPAKLAESRGGIIGVMIDVTLILSQIESGDPRAAEKLLPLVYDDGRAWRRRSVDASVPPNRSLRR